MPYYAGLDLHRSMSVIVLKDAQGQLICQGRVDNDPVALEKFFAPHREEPIVVALEATTNYAWMYDTLERLGCQVELAHPPRGRNGRGKRTSCAADSHSIFKAASAIRTRPLCRHHRKFV